MPAPKNSPREISVTTKLLVSGSAVMLLMIAVQAWFYLDSVVRRDEVDENNQLLTLYNDYTHTLDEQERASAALAVSFADRPDVQQRLLAQDRDGLLQVLAPVFVTLQKNYRIVHLYVHQPNGFVFLRVHDPAHFGDATISYRQVNAQALATHEAQAGIELDPDRLGVDGVAPILVGGKLIGLVEVGLDYDQAFLDSLKQRNGGTDYRIWVTYAAAAPSGLWPKADTPAAPSNQLFYYASTASRQHTFNIDEAAYLRVLQGGPPEMHLIAVGSDTLAVMLAPLEGYGGRILGVLEIISQRTEAILALRRTQWAIASVAVLLAALALALLAVSVEHTVQRSLRHLTAVAHRQLAGDLTARVQHLPRDEFGQLGRTFNSLSDQLAVTIRSLEDQIVTRQQAEKALQESVDKIEAIFHSITDSVLITDLSGTIVDCNEAALRQYGVAQREACLGRSFFDIVLASERPAAASTLAAAQGADHSGWVEHRLTRLDGTSFDAEIDVVLLPAQFGQADHFLIVVHDITERLEAQAQEVRRRERLEKVVQWGKEVTQITDLSPCLLAAYTAIREGLGFDRAGLFLYEAEAGLVHGSLHTNGLGQTEDLLAWVVPASSEPLFENVLKTPSGIYVAEAGFPPPRPAGVGHSEPHAAVIAWAGQEPVAIMTVDNYPTGRPLAAEDLEALRLLGGYIGLAIKNARLNTALEQRVADRTAELENANKELEAFAYSVSHDLRTPLRSIDGFSRVLEEDCAPQLDAAGLSYLQRIRAAAQRMGDLIEALLGLSRLVRDQPRRARIDLSQLASVIAAEWQHTEPWRSVEWQFTPGLTAVADERLMRIALDNLLGNAWKFTRERTPARIEFGLEWLPDGTRAYFVRDNGAGFDMAHADKLFGAFQRLHSNHEFPGTGVGLATVQRIIQRHGGNIWAEGRVDRGAVFYFTLPDGRS